MTSYQKLKKENEKLRHDIYLLVKGTPVQKLELQGVYEMKFSLGDICMHGTRDFNQSMNLKAKDLIFSLDLGRLVTPEEVMQLHKG